MATEGKPDKEGDEERPKLPKGFEHFAKPPRREPKDKQQEEKPREEEEESERREEASRRQRKSKETEGDEKGAKGMFSSHIAISLGGNLAETSLFPQVKSPSRHRQ